MKELIISKPFQNPLNGRLLPALCAAVASLTAACMIQAQDFGVHFLGNTSDPVNGSAGVVPIANWNNIANATSTIGSPMTITGSDGVTTATLTLIGAGTVANNAWNSGLAGDGADDSLMDGYMDVGNGGGGGATITGLTAAHYNVYIYGFPDQTRPSNGGDWLPNYNVNGTTYYAPLLGNSGASTYDTTGVSLGGVGFSGYTPATAGLGNSAAKPPAANFGNYVEIVLVAPTNGTIAIEAGTDSHTWRSPLNGIELVPVTGAPPTANVPLTTPVTAATALLAGSPVTLTATANGTTPMSFFWYTDGGSGNALTNIPGATGSNLVVNTTGFTVGSYDYSFVASNSLGTNLSPEVTLNIVSVLMQDMETTNPPAPGPNDISQLVWTNQNDDGIHQYTDDGASGNHWDGQTFTTGSNPNGYVLKTLAWKTAGNDNTFASFQLYDLYIYSLSAGGTEATVVASYEGYGGGMGLDWFQWIGLNTPLEPNSQYAYTLGRAIGGGGWEHIADNGNNPYAGGQLCSIASTGGAVTYGTTGTSDGVFDIGLGIAQAAMATVPTYSPAVSSIYAGTPVTLNENAVGAPTLTYQWLADNGSGTLAAVNGATNASLAVNTAGFAPGNYEYAVAVSNSYGGSTSATLTIRVVAASAPQIVSDISPSPNEGYVGQTLTFSTSFTGTLPITYQWMADTGSGPQPVSPSSNPTATNSTLVLTNVQLAAAATYSVVAHNSQGNQPSGSSVLTVLPDPAPPAANTYGALALANNPVAYWQLNDTEDPSTGVSPAYDATGHGFSGLYGIYSLNAYDGVTGPQSPAFPGFDAANGALETAINLTNSWVTVPLDLSSSSATATITMWINPAPATPAYTGLFFNRTFNAGFGFGGANNSAAMAELGYAWNNNAGATWQFHTYLFPEANQWNFVALVIKPSSATFYLYYIDPALGPQMQTTNNVMVHAPEAFNSGITTIGTDFQNPLGRAFSGSIGEVAVYDKALTGGQVTALFNKGAGTSLVAPTPVPLTMTRGAGGSLNLNWNLGVLLQATNLTGPWVINAATPPYTVAPTNTQMFYQVQ